MTACVVISFRNALTASCHDSGRLPEEGKSASDKKLSKFRSTDSPCYLKQKQNKLLMKFEQQL